jgi:hypothetical protein
VAVMYPDPSVSTELNDDRILRIGANKSCQMGHAVAVMHGGRSACIPRTPRRLLGAAGCRRGRDLPLCVWERDCRVAFRCHSVRTSKGYQITCSQIGPSGSFGYTPETAW